MRLFPVNNRRGFTIVEMLVSMAVLALIVALLGNMASNVSRVWQNGNAQSDRRRNVRAIVDLISADLGGALLPVDPAAEPTKPNLQFTLNPSAVSDEFRHPDALFWQAPVATDQSRGDVAQIGYFVQWDVETKPENPRARLCRFLVNPTDENYKIYDDRLNWLNDSIIEQVAPAHNRPEESANGEQSQPPGWRGMLAEDVIGFWARWRDASHNQVTSYDSRVTMELPRVVEISVVQLDSTAANRVTKDLQMTLAVLAKTSTDANDFIQKLAETDLPELRALLPGTRAMSASVRLENAR
jgi:prepilin-type N-terminal cleavage/methylation domain-containing protein